MWLFWVYFGVFVLLTILVETECFTWATLSAIVTAIVFGLVNKDVFLIFWQEHTKQTLFGVGIYIVVGVVWSFAKWFLYLLKFRSEFRAVAESFKSRNGLSLSEPIPSDKMDDFGYYSKHKYDRRPMAADHKSRIVAWMSFWPCSIIGYIFNDPIRKIFSGLFNLLRGSYQKMSNSIVNDAEFNPRPKDEAKKA